MNMPESHHHKEEIKPFWLCMTQFFLFPFQWLPLIYALVLALCSMFGMFLPIPFAVILVQIGILLAVSRYSFKVIYWGSQGVFRVSDYPLHEDDDLTGLPWKLFAILLITGVVIGLLGVLSPLFAIIGMLVFSLALPAMVVTLLQTHSIGQSLNPLQWLQVIGAMGWPYFLLCLFLILLSGGSEIALPLLMPLLGPWTALPIFNFVMIYFSWVMSALLGYAMHQYHHNLGIETLETASSSTQPARAGSQAGGHNLSPKERAIDEEVAGWIEMGDMETALRIAYEAQRLASDDVHAQRRYHRLLVASGKTDEMLRRAPQWIDLLMQHKLDHEALEVYQQCRELNTDFNCQHPEYVLAFARIRWHAGDAHTALALISGFDKRNPGSALIPEAYELAARILVQDLGRPDTALTILRTLEKRYPQSPQVEELRWLLRDTLK